MNNSKKGSSAVFIMVILAALVSITMALIHGVKTETLRSRMDGIISLAGDSLMSEFNRDIQEEYGIFLAKGSDRELGNKLREYVEHSTKDMEGVDLESVKVSGSRFSTVNVDLIRDQILEYMKLAYAEDRFDTLTEGAAEGSEENTMENRTLKHGPTAASLPSSSIPDKSLTSMAQSIADNIKEADKAFVKGTEQYLINRYATDMFNSRISAVSTEHFFRNEVEYILGGELSDRKNEKRVEMALKAMRFPLNLAHIYGDAEKRAQTLAMAEILTPGAAAPATQAVLASTWAYAEADNDVELLWQGHKVPLVKDSSTWAMDLDSAVEGLMGGTAMPAVEKGYDYSQYLQVLLFFKDENVKISRILDLIQINTRMSLDGDFLMNEHWMGLAIQVRINGVDYRYEKKY